MRRGAPVAGGAQNWRLHSWWKSPRLLKSAWFKFSAKDYGFYNHMKERR
jgi:hypothetical protein